MAHHQNIDFQTCLTIQHNIHPLKSTPFIDLWDLKKKNLTFEYVREFLFFSYVIIVY